MSACPAAPKSGCIHISLFSGFGAALRYAEPHFGFGAPRPWRFLLFFEPPRVAPGVKWLVGGWACLWAWADESARGGNGADGRRAGAQLY